MNINYAFSAIKFGFLLLLCCGIAACPKDGGDDGELSGFIYFESPSGSISKLNVSDNTVQKVTNNATQPDLLPNGDLIAVEGASTGRIFQADPLGANRRTIVTFQNDQSTPHLLALHAPRTSKDQKYIAYDGDSYRHVTYIVDRVSGDLVLSVGEANNSTQHYYSPSWAPDGSLYLQGGKSTNNGIYKVDAAFTKITRVDPSLSNVEFPSVSPDGNSIAFIKDFELWVMGIDGSNPTSMETGLAGISAPVWSPDSQHIATIDYSTLYIVNVATKTKSKVNNNAREYTQMCWK